VRKRWRVLESGRKRIVREPEAAISKKPQPSSEVIARIALGCVEDKKAKDVRVLDISGLTILADYFIIATAETERQSRAIINEIIVELKKHGVAPYGSETPRDSMWALLDYGVVVIHVFQSEARAFYDLDNYWCDGEQVTLEPIAPTSATSAAEASLPA